MELILVIVACIIACIIIARIAYNRGVSAASIESVSGTANMVMVSTYAIAASRLDLSDEMSAIMAEAATIGADEISDFIVALVDAAGDDE